MASSSHGKRGPELLPSGSCYYEPEEPHFFMPIIAELIQNGKIEIPEGFIKRYGKELHNSVHLKVQDHETSRIQLHQEDQKVWLGEGLENFMQNYSITEDQFLVFRFEGNSTFDVTIFDPTSEMEMETEYPDNKYDAKGETTAEFEHPAFESHNEFKSKYPYVRIPMHGGGYMKSGGVNISRTFLEKAKMKRGNYKGSRMITLKYLGRSWPVKLTYTPDGRGKLCQGWQAFLEDNSLLEGDTVVFEHSRAATFDGFKVTSFRRRG